MADVLINFIYNFFVFLSEVLWKMPWLFAIVVIVVLYLIVKIQHNKTKVSREIKERNANAEFMLAQLAQESAQRQSKKENFMKSIENDFTDFHESDAKNDVTSSILEYINFKYGDLDKLSKDKFDSNFELHKLEDASPLRHVSVIKLDVVDYAKSLHYATVKYKGTVSFSKNYCQHQVVCVVEYTLKLKDEFGDKTYLTCAQCGGTIEEAGGICPYCGTVHVRDTTLNWVVTDIREV